MRSITLDHMVANNKRPVRVTSPLAMSHFVTASTTTTSPTISTKVLEKASDTSVSPRGNSFFFTDNSNSYRNSNSNSNKVLRTPELAELDPAEEEKCQDKQDEKEEALNPEISQRDDFTTSDVEIDVRDESSFDPFGIRILDDTEEQGFSTYDTRSSDSDHSDEAKTNESDIFGQNESSFDPFDINHSQIENVSPTKSSDDSSIQVFDIFEERVGIVPPIVSHSFTQEQRRIHAAVERRNEHLEKENWDLRRLLEKKSMILQEKNRQLLELEQMRKDMFLDLEMARSFGITLGRKLQLCTQERDEAQAQVEELISQHQLEESDDSTVVIANTSIEHRGERGAQRGNDRDESREEILAPHDELMDEFEEFGVEKVGDGMYMV